MSVRGWRSESSTLFFCPRIASSYFVERVRKSNAASHAWWSCIGREHDAHEQYVESCLGLMAAKESDYFSRATVPWIAAGLVNIRAAEGSVDRMGGAITGRCSWLMWVLEAHNTFWLR